MTFIFIDPARRKKRKVQKSAESQAVLDALDEYLEGNIQEPVKWLARFWKDQAAVFTYRELLTLVTDESEPEKLFSTWFKDYSKLLAEKITPMWQSAFLAGANTNPIINGISYQVNTSETSVREWILNRGAELVTNVTEDQVNAVRYIIAESQANKMGSAETARYIRPTVGLTERQAAANLRLYNTTKEQLRADHPRMTDESIERKARAIAGRYAQSQQMTRAETIARTEVAFAYNQGNDTAIRQAMSQGLVPIMRKVWSTADDGHVCPACEDLEGTEIDMDSEFKVTVGKKVKRTLSVSIPPLHPRCKCAVMYEETGEYMSPAVSYEGLEDEWADLGEDAQIIDVNPDDRPDNCVNCTIAYEMRRRNKSVVAGAGMPELQSDAFAGWKNPEVIPVEPGKGAFDFIDAALGLWGDGARAQIAILRPPKFEGAPLNGHSFIAERDKISATFLDVQQGLSYNVDELRAMLQGAFKIDICRIDQLEISEIGFNACKEVK